MKALSKRLVVEWVSLINCVMQSPQSKLIGDLIFRLFSFQNVVTNIDFINKC